VMDFYEDDLLAVAGPIEVIRLHDDALLRRHHPAQSGHEKPAHGMWTLTEHRLKASR
jgi:hypothetical protein